MVLSLFSGLAYIALGWINDIYIAALFWYFAVVLISTRGYLLYKSFDIKNMSEASLKGWYDKTRILFYFFFLAWLVIFLIYAPESDSGMHYIAIFTEIGASTVASALLFPDKKLYKPILLFLITPLAIYFFMVGTWYGYVLTFFAVTFGWVLLYAANGSNALFSKTIFQATHDFLTGLYSRQYFVEYLQKKMNNLKQSGEFSYILLIDLDYFKTVNDSLGHDIGDRLLQEVVKRIQNNLPENAMLARLGGDEFIITGSDFNNKKECKKNALQFSEELLGILKATYTINQHHLYISASIGVSLISSNGTSAVDFIKEADIAMYEVKDKGRDGVFFYDKEISARVEYNLRLEQLLHLAIEKNELYLAYQPQLNEKQKVMGVEVLARWKSKELGEVSPVEFISIAEKTGLIVEIGQHILESAFITLKEWGEKGIDIKHMSINISVRQFMHHNIIKDVTALCNKYYAAGMKSKLIFEITESIVAEGDNIVETINEIKKLGIRFSIDDFGTGYSSLSYIRKLPVDEIKIDRHFINELSKYSNAEEMVDIIIHIANIFNLVVVAEGVETRAQQDFLIEHDCKVFQGGLYSQPLSKDEFEKFYLENK
ncbi:MAG: EAL domain-containing protein [Gammaproteobacteria bacterium]|nr:EAL domain-containing protein [Gammaproteobacteria bacterium]